MTTKKHIAVGLIAPTPRLPGGHAVQAMRLLQGWHGDAEVQVRLVPINPAPPRVLGSVAGIKYLRTAVTQVSYWPSLMRMLRQVDVIHVFAASNASFFVTSLPGILVARSYRKPVIVNYRGDSRDHLAKSATAKMVLRSVDANIVPSAYFQEIFHDLGIPAQIVPNVADLVRFRYRVRKPIRPRLLSTRNFEPIYNVACTLRAFARVQARYADASLVLVGGGTDERALRTLAADLGVRNVRFAGRVSQEEIHRFYDAADIYVQAPVVDNMPGSVIEAFASGLPVISTAVGGVPMILEHGVHGLLACEDDDEAIAAHVIRLLEHPDYARHLAAAAFATCSRYDWPVVREQWRAVYRSVTSARQPQSRRGSVCNGSITP